MPPSSRGMCAELRLELDKMSRSRHVLAETRKGQLFVSIFNQ